MDGWTLLEKSAKFEVKPVLVVAGKEYFLKSLVCEKLEKFVLPDEAEMARSVFDGESVEWATVKDDLSSPPFGSPTRFVLIRDADDFVSNYRDRLEKYVDKPSPCGVLVLEVSSWKSNTRLAKQIPEAQTIVCEPKKPANLATFLAKWCPQRHGKKIASDAVNLLVELVDPELGLLEQELAKLSVYVADRDTITVKDVDDLVARNRNSTVWVMLDALAANQPGPALRTLHRLIEQGEDPNGLFAGMAWQLRKMAQAHRLLGDGISLQGAIAQAGLPPFKAQSIQQHLRILGPKANRLFDWLMDAEMALKSSGQLSPAAIVERLLVQLA
jgi:DNA polymerase-3 subunit delta